MEERGPSKLRRLADKVDKSGVLDVGIEFPELDRRNFFPFISMPVASFLTYYFPEARFNSKIQNPDFVIAKFPKEKILDFLRRDGAKLGSLNELFSKFKKIEEAVNDRAFNLNDNMQLLSKKLYDGSFSFEFTFLSENDFYKVKKKLKSFGFGVIINKSGKIESFSINSNYLKFIEDMYGFSDLKEEVSSEIPINKRGSDVEEKKLTFHFESSPSDLQMFATVFLKSMMSFLLKQAVEEGLK